MALAEMMDDWRVAVSAKSTRGKYRFTIWKGGELKAIAPVNLAFADEAEAEASGAEVLLARYEEGHHAGYQAGWQKGREKIAADYRAATADKDAEIERLNRSLDVVSREVTVLRGTAITAQDELHDALYERDRARARGTAMWLPGLALSAMLVLGLVLTFVVADITNACL